MTVWRYFLICPGWPHRQWPPSSTGQREISWKFCLFLPCSSHSCLEGPGTLLFTLTLEFTPFAPQIVQLGQTNPSHWQTQPVSSERNSPCCSPAFENVWWWHQFRSQSSSGVALGRASHKPAFSKSLSSLQEVLVPCSFNRLSPPSLTLINNKHFRMITLNVIHYNPHILRIRKQVQKSSHPSESIVKPGMTLPGLTASQVCPHHTVSPERKVVWDFMSWLGHRPSV